jgi:hypothetical protein
MDPPAVGSLLVASLNDDADPGAIAAGKCLIDAGIRQPLQRR